MVSEVNIYISNNNLCIDKKKNICPVNYYLLGAQMQELIELREWTGVRKHGNDVAGSGSQVIGS